MNEQEETQIYEWLQEGIAAAKAGRREQARQRLMQVIEVNERNEQAWLWLSGVVDEDEDRLICLENVLALNPDNAQARAGLRWLQERGVVAATETEPLSEVDGGDDGPAPGRAVPPHGAPESPATVHTPSQSPPDAESLPFMTEEGCVYCGLPVGKDDLRCPHCRGQLVFKQFKRQERSAEAYLLQPFWTILAGLNVVEFFLIGVLRDKIAEIPSLIVPYLSYVVGRAVTDPAGVDMFISLDLMTPIVRFTLLGLAILGGLVAVGLFLRISLAHPIGLTVIALHFVIYVALFVMGFSGYFFAAFQAVLALLVARFMFLTVDDFYKEAQREWLEPDRHVSNDVDYFARGRAYEKRGMWAKALLHWQRAAAINPDRDTYFAAMARAYAQLGRHNRALAQVDRAMQVSRRPQELQSLRELILEAQRRGATPGASDSASS